MDKGYVQVYKGTGKGKTTAALGLAMRAAGAGYRVFIAQFVKGMHYSELNSFAKLSDSITLRQYGTDSFIIGTPGEMDVTSAQRGFEEVRKAVQSGEYRVVILDEAGIAAYFGLCSVDELLELINNKPEHVELIITGRYVDEKIIDRADLVTEMCEIKHYYQKGILGRVGIES